MLFFMPFVLPLLLVNVCSVSVFFVWGNFIIVNKIQTYMAQIGKIFVSLFHYV